MNKELSSNFKGVIDVTLREGMQFSGFQKDNRGKTQIFTLEEQIKIIQQHIKIGVDYTEVGNPYASETFQNIVYLTQIPNRPPFLAHVRNRLSDIEAAIDAGVEGVNILCNSSEKRLKGMGISFEEHLGILQQCVLTAQSVGKIVRVGSEHYFSAESEDKERAKAIFRLADSLKVSRISIPDTIGIAMTWDVADEVADLKKEIKADIEVHFHNDLGQAEANALAAVKNGANWVNTSILGIGERTGITSLSTFLVALYKIDSSLVKKYHLEYLTGTDRLVADMIDKEVPFDMITSENGFAHKAGIHINGVINHGPDTYELIPPGVIGNDRNLVIGTAISGRTNQSQVDDFYNRYGTK